MFDGLPGEVEYDVDLSDQKKLHHQSEETDEETVGLFDWLLRLRMGEDLADSVDQFICAWDRVVGTEIDTLVLLLLGKGMVHLIRLSKSLDWSIKGRSPKSRLEMRPHFWTFKARLLAFYNLTTLGKLTFNPRGVQRN